jgi:hypothetical protein
LARWLLNSRQTIKVNTSIPISQTSIAPSLRLGIILAIQGNTRTVLAQISASALSRPSSLSIKIVRYSNLRGPKQAPLLELFSIIYKIRRKHFNHDYPS